MLKAALPPPALTALGDVYFEIHEREVYARGWARDALSPVLCSVIFMLAAGEPWATTWLQGMQRWGAPKGCRGLQVASVYVVLPRKSAYNGEVGVLAVRRRVLAGG